MRKLYVFAGLLILIIGLILTLLYDYSVNVKSYEPRGYTKNTYQTDEPLKTTVSGCFSSGEILFFNFTPGRWWSGVEESFEPPETYPDFAVPAHKKVTFLIQTPSGQNCSVTTYVVMGTFTYAVILENKSDDIELLPNGNKTQDAGIECLVKRNGTYTVQAYAIVPLIAHAVPGSPAPELLTLDQDPPRIMALWRVKDSIIYPYRFLLPYGLFLICAGAFLGVWGLKSKRKQRPFKSKILHKKKR